MEALYKAKKTGLANRSVRAKIKETSSKSKRADLLAAKRRIPLSEVDDDKVQNPVVPSQDSTKQMNRLDKLKEWRKARDEVKARKEKENAKKPPPFRFGNPVQKKGQTMAPKNTHFTMGAGCPSTKPKIQPATNRSVSTSRPSKIVPPSHSTKSSCKPSKIPTTQPSKLSTSSKPSKPVTTQPSKTKVTREASTAATRSSARLAARQKQETNTKPRATSSRVQSQRVTRSTKIEKKSPIQRKAVTTKPKPSSSIKTRSSKRLQKEPEPVLDVEMQPVPHHIKPTTPVKSHVPVTPSPLLKSHRRNPPFVNHPAWIPNAKITPEMSAEPNFDDAFAATFSPFQFTAGAEMKGTNTGFTFTFKKDMPSLDMSAIHYDSLEDESPNIKPVSPEGVAQRVTPNPKLVRKSLSKSRSAKKSNRRIMKSEEDMVVQVLDLDCEDLCVPQTTDNAESADVEMVPVDDSESEKETDQVDVAHFRGLHSAVVDKLMKLCQLWEEKVASLEQEETDGSINTDDILGQIRTTVCQAQLLMRSKMKQYLGLVGDAETKSGERKTTAEDLQGFWDMVYFQVEDVYKKFDKLVKLESNGWQNTAPTPKKRKGKKRQAAAKKSAVNDESNERLRAAREKREAERNRLREMRMAAKRAREQQENAAENSDGDQQMVVEESAAEEIYVTPKKQKTEHTPRSKSASKKRRRSQRLLAKSVFSPAPMTSVQQGVDVPTGILLDL